MSLPSPFRFLELPMELQEMVLEHYYGGNYGVYVSLESSYGSTDYLCVSGDPGAKTPIERVSRCIRKLGRQIRWRLFNGTLTIEFNDNFKRQAIEKFCEQLEYGWVRARVKTLELVGNNKQWRRRIRMAAINLITSQLPVLGTISISHVTQKDVVGAALSAVNTKLYKSAFLAGSRDIKYDSPVRTLEAQFLAKALEVNGMHHVKVLVNSGTWWEGNRGITLVLGVSFQVTAYSWTAVDREYKSGLELDRLGPLHGSTNNFLRIMKMAMHSRRRFETFAHLLGFSML